MDKIVRIKSSYQRVLDALALERKHFPLPLAAPEIMAVSKTRDVDTIEAAIEAGFTLFGENRVQEAAEKWPELKAIHPDIRLNLIGPLQTNKVAAAVDVFDGIESVDRPKLAAAIAKEQAKQGRVLELLIQVNTGCEPQKSGILPDEVQDFYDYCTRELALKIAGLMCIPPQEDVVAPHFGLLNMWAKKLDLAVLSMGMSHDYIDAVKLGATRIRLGTALFGPRG